MQKKYMLIPAAVLALGIGSMSLAATNASAVGIARHEQMISRFAQAFGKSEAEVKAVIDQVKAENQAARLAELTAKLDAGVSAGKITANQKQLILAKFAALRSEREQLHENGQKPNLKERMANRQDRKEEMQKWATDNGISVEFLKTLMPQNHKQQ